MAINIRKGSMVMHIKRVVVLFFMLSMSSSVFAGISDECTINDQGQINTDMTGNDSCNTDPMQRKVKAYKIGLCTELPYHTNYKNVCDFIFESDTPVVLIAEKSGSKSIEGIGDVTLIEGKEYTHSMLLISNTSEVKTLVEFDSPRLGKTGSGTHCWTVGTSINTASKTSRSGFSADCGTLAESNPQYNTEKSSYYSSAIPGVDAPAMERNFPDWDGGWTNELMSNETDKALFDSGTPTWDDTTNAVYWLAGRGINPSIIVTPDTANIDLRFLVSWGSIIQYSGTDDSGRWDTDCNTTPCIGQIRIAGFDFEVQAN